MQAEQAARILRGALTNKEFADALKMALSDIAALSDKRALATLVQRTQQWEDARAMAVSSGAIRGVDLALEHWCDGVLNPGGLRGSE